MTPQQYCLRWKFHHSNLQNMFTQLLDRGCFCDVTIACEGQTLKAHRVVLCACSTYFDSILTNCSVEKEPIIVMRDCKFEDIKSLLDFMYKGEINVEHNNLSSLLKTAEDLRIKGLAEVSWRDEMEGGGDAVITRSRKQFAAAVASCGPAGNQDESTQHSTNATCVDQHISPIQRHVSANVIAGTNHHTSNFQQSPIHLLQSRLNEPPPDLHNRSSQPYPHYISRTNQMQPILPMARLTSSNYSHQSHPLSQQQPQPFQNRNNFPHNEITSILPVKRKRGRPPLDGEFDSYSTPKISHVESGAPHSTAFVNCEPAASIVEAVLDDGSQTATNQHHSEPTQETPCLDTNNQHEGDSRGPNNASPDHVRLVDLPAILSNTESPRELRQHNRRQNHPDDPKAPAAAVDEDWPEYGMQMDCEEETGGLIPKLERPDTPGIEDEEARKHMYQKTEAKQHRSMSPPTAPANSSDMLTPQDIEDWQDVIKMNDYLTTGKRPQFWDERFTMRVMEAIKNKELEMKKGAYLLGVSYGTLYGRNALWTRGDAFEISVSSGSIPMQLQHNAGPIRQQLEESSRVDDWDHLGNNHPPPLNRQQNSPVTSSLAKYYEPPNLSEASKREAWLESQSIRAKQTRDYYHFAEQPSSYRYHQQMMPLSPSQRHTTYSSFR